MIVVRMRGGNSLRLGERQDAKLLQLPIRRRLYDAIHANMGICEMELSEALGENRNTIKYHLKRLHQAELVRSRRQGRKVHYFTSDINLVQLQRAVASTQNDTRRRILRMLHEEPDKSWRAISRSLGLTPRAVRWHLQQMEGLGLIEIFRNNGACRIELSPALDAVMSGDPARMGDETPKQLQRPQAFRDRLGVKAWRVTVETPDSSMRKPKDSDGPLQEI